MGNVQAECFDHGGAPFELRYVILILVLCKECSFALQTPDFLIDFLDLPGIVSGKFFLYFFQSVGAVKPNNVIAQIIHDVD